MNKFVLVFGRAFIVTSMVAFISIYISTTFSPVHEVVIATNTYGEHWFEVGLVLLGIVCSFFVVKNEEKLL